MLAGRSTPCASTEPQPCSRQANPRCSSFWASRVAAPLEVVEEGGEEAGGGEEADQGDVHGVALVLHPEHRPLRVVLRVFYWPGKFFFAWCALSPCDVHAGGIRSRTVTAGVGRAPPAACHS